MFYALVEPYFSLEGAGKICFITKRLDIKVNKSTTFYAVRSKQILIATFRCCLPIISEIKQVDFLTFIFSDYPPFH